MKKFVVKRPSVLPAVLAPMSAVREILAVDSRRLRYPHQAQSPQAQAGVPTGLNGTSEFAGEGTLAAKRMDVSGVPPRGKPV